MFFLLVFIPLLSAVISGFAGGFIGGFGSSFFSTLLLFFSCLISYFAFFIVALNGQPVYLLLLPWIYSGNLEFNWGFLFDSLTVIILVVVLSVSFLVHFYSISYISNDPHRSRFISYLSLFTFFIVILVTSDNFVQIFVGWEGVGLCSYLLINFWFTRIQANKAAIKAILVNRVGDFGLLLGILGAYALFGSVDYATIFSLTPLFATKQFTFFSFSFFYIDLISFFIFVGSVGKSAQLGLHTWLPDAIEGPTPVSALIHAATIVTAGVFLIARCSPLFEFSTGTLFIITLLGAITAFFAATTGLLQNDLKRVIAYSTCSQLGYIVFACGLSSYSVGVFHLANHAFFKALLFLSAGSVIHAIGDEQDIRRMGGLVLLLPFTYSIILIGSLALIGFPFLTGFYSKDVVLELAFSQYTLSGHFAHWLGTVAAFFTAFYSVRLLYLTFLAHPASYRSLYLFSHDTPFFIGFSLIPLALGSIFIGFFIKDLVIGVGSPFWGQSIFIHPSSLVLLDAEFLPSSIKNTPVLFSCLGAFSAYCFYSFFSEKLFFFKFSTYGRHCYSFFNKKWFFDKTFINFIGSPFLRFSYFTTYQNIDRGFIELFGPHGFTLLFYRFSFSFSKLQSGHIYHYLFSMLTFFSLCTFFFVMILLPLFLRR